MKKRMINTVITGKTCGTFFFRASGVMASDINPKFQGVYNKLPLLAEKCLNCGRPSGEHNGHGMCPNL